MYYIGSMAFGQNDIQHFGIPGMKWGIRRYQNDDGTLTRAGIERYRESLNSIRRLGGGGKEAGFINKIHDRANRLQERTASRFARGEERGINKFANALHKAAVNARYGQGGGGQYAGTSAKDRLGGFLKRASFMSTQVKDMAKGLRSGKSFMERNSRIMDFDMSVLSKLRTEGRLNNPWSKTRTGSAYMNERVPLSTRLQTGFRKYAWNPGSEYKDGNEVIPSAWRQNKKRGVADYFWA